MCIFNKWKARNCSVTPVTPVTPVTKTVKTVKKTVTKKAKSPVRSKSVKPKKSPKSSKKVRSKSPLKSPSPKSPKTKSPSPRSPSPRSPSPSSSRSSSPKSTSPNKGNKSDCIDRSKLPLQAHQKAIVEHMKRNRSLIVAHEVGSGKTLAAVTVSQCFLDDHPTGKIIVVTPLSLQENFKKEMITYGVPKKMMAHYKFYTLQGFATEYASKYASKKCGGGKTPVLLIIDEAHNLRTPVKTRKTSKRSKTRSEIAIECAKTADKVLLLTATAVYNEPRDIANLVAMAKGIDPPSKKNFESIISNKYTFEKFFSCVISFYKTPKDENYPTSKEHHVKIEMSSSYYEKYMQVENVLRGVLRGKKYFDDKDKEWKYAPSESEDLDPWVFLNGLRKASNKFEGPNGCIKCDWVLKKVKKAAKRGNKTVIYSFFLDYGVKQLQKLFDEHGIVWVEVTGKSKPSERTAAVKTYNEGDVNVLFITKAGGEGLDLKGTRNVIVFESSWNKATDNQVIGRAIRYLSHTHLPKKKQKVDIYYLEIVKPKSHTDRYESADSMMRKLSTKKEAINNNFLKDLETLSIEKSKC